MADKSELMTIKEFASASGRSPQAIYKQLSTRLAAFLREVDGQKYIERRALDEVFGIRGDQPIRPEIDNSDTEVDNVEHPLYAILRDELEAKNRLIEKLQAELAEERKYSREQADKLTALADQAQRLHAGTMKQMLPAGDKPAQTEVETVSDVEPVAPVTVDPEPSEREPKPGIRQWFKAIFG